MTSLTYISLCSHTFFLSISQCSCSGCSLLGLPVHGPVATTFRCIPHYLPSNSLPAPFPAAYVLFPFGTCYRLGLHSPGHCVPTFVSLLPASYLPHLPTLPGFLGFVRSLQALRLPFYRDYTAHLSAFTLLILLPSCVCLLRVRCSFCTLILRTYALITPRCVYAVRFCSRSFSHLGSTVVTFFPTTTLRLPLRIFSTLRTLPSAMLLSAAFGSGLFPFGFLLCAFAFRLLFCSRICYFPATGIPVRCHSAWGSFRCLGTVR